MRSYGAAPNSGQPSPHPDGRYPVQGKSPSPLSPAPALANFRARGAAVSLGPTPSLSMQSHGGAVCGAQRLATMGESYRQRSPTTVLHWDARRTPSGGGRPQPDGCRSPLMVQYTPPPPMRPTAGAGRRNIFDDDANAETGSAVALSPAPGNPNSTVSGSVSPLSETRFVHLAQGHHRPASTAALQHSTFAGRVSIAPGVTSLARDARGANQRAASSIPFVRPPVSKTAFRHNCGAIVDNVDPRTGALVAQYRCCGKLGAGGFAEVYEFTELSTEQRYACKIIDKEKMRNSLHKVQREVDMHRRVEHPNIVRMHKVFNDDYYVFILLELCSSTNLMEVSNQRKALPVEEVQHIMRQLTSAVITIHGKGIIHRDIKLGNIMIDLYGNVKLGDFGFATELKSGSERKMRLCGTPNYIAPEILECGETKVGYGFEVDIWSLGVVLFTLAYGHPPFEAKDVPSTYQRIRRIDYRFPTLSDNRGGGGTVQVPECCKALIRSMLQRDPAARPTPQEVLDSAFLSRARAGSDSAGSLLSSLQRPREARAREVWAHDGAVEYRHAGSPYTGARESRSPIVASPILARSPYGGCTPSSVRRGVSAAAVDGQNQHTPSDAFPSSPQSLPAGGDAEVRKTLHEFLHEQDPSSGTATTGDRTDTEMDDTGRGRRLTAYGSDSSPHVGGRRIDTTHYGPQHPYSALRVHDLPEAPAIFFRNAVYASKYGHGFTLSTSVIRDYLTMVFNDRTELMYDEQRDLAFYRTRVRGHAATGEVGGDGSAAEAGEPSGAARAVAEEWKCFPGASASLRPDPSGGTGGSSYSTPAQKKFAIITFLSPYLTGTSMDATFPALRSTLRHLSRESARSALFSSRAKTPEGPVHQDVNAAEAEDLGRNLVEPAGWRAALILPVSLREAVMRRVSELDMDYSGVDMVLTAARFSNQTYQLSLMCTPPCPSALIPIAESPVVPRESRWKFDALVYSPFRAVFGIETEHSRFHESFRDIRKDVCTTRDGRVFFAAGSTSETHRQFMIPVELLRIFCDLLRSIKAPAEIVDCFHF